MKLLCKLTPACLALGILANGCDAPSASGPPEADDPVQQATSPEVAPALVRRFDSVRRRVGPAATTVCVQQGDAPGCSFSFRLDPRADLPAGALVTRADDGAALIVATGSLLQAARSDDELAFVLAHMAGHHIEGHRRGGNEVALAQTLISGAQGAVTGNIQSLVNTAIRLNSVAGTRSYSRGEEIAADALATRIVDEAGFDPVAGIAFFERSSPETELFLEIHRPDPARAATVRRVDAALE